MKPLLTILACVIFAGCKTTEKPTAHLAVTASAQTSVARAATAAHESQEASQRSSVHIKALRTGAQRISDEAGKAIRLLDHP